MDNCQSRPLSGDRGNSRVLALLIVLSILGNLLTLANPGFFSHDEWQKVDSLDSYGFAEYVRDYGQLRAGPQFGFPVRPLGFIQQGVSALFMRNAPVIAHGIDVAVHMGVVIVLWLTLGAWGIDRKRASWISAIFAISPLTTLCIGWVGASFDRWYTLFCLVSILGFVRALRSTLNLRNGILLFFGSALAIVSKETAVMLPAAIAGVWLLNKLTGDRSSKIVLLLISLAIVTIPILGYLIIRLPALEASFSGKSAAGAYTPTLGNVINNVALYLGQPFLFRTVDLDSASLLPNSLWYLALCLHLSILAALVFRFGAMRSAFYLFGYFLFLVPVLPLGTHGAHYLYASAIPFSMAVVYAFVPATASMRGYAIPFCMIIAMLTVRAMEIQWGLYARGLCQSRFLSTLDAQIQSSGNGVGSNIDIYVKAGAPAYVARSAVFGRAPYDGVKGPSVLIRDRDAKRPEQWMMTSSCEVIRQ